MTKWHEDDLAGRIMERDKDNWTVLEITMEAEEDDVLGREVGERLWPEYFTEEMVERAKLDQRSWYALYQQKPRPAGGSMFKREWIQFYGDKCNHRRMTKVMVVDPSGGFTPQQKAKRDGDYTAIFIIGLGEDSNYYVLDIVRDRLSLTERAETVFRLHRKWKPLQVRYERYGMQGDIDHLRREMELQSYRFRIFEVAGRVAKKDRVQRLEPLFREGLVWFPNEMYYTDKSGCSNDLVKVFIEEEFLTFPVGRHDDLIDSLARICEPELRLPWPKPQEHQNMMTKILQFSPSVSSMGY
jgi:predicted phage terminase large subunit-like protein